MLPCPNNADLVLGGYPGVYADRLKSLLKLLIGHSVQFPASDRNIMLRHKTDIPSDSLCGGLVVPGDHNRPDAGFIRIRNRIVYLLAWRIDHCRQTDQDEMLLIPGPDSSVFDMFVGIGQHTQGASRELLIGQHELRPKLIGQRHSVFVQQHVVASSEQDIRSAFCQQGPLTVEGMHGGHQLPVGVKRDLRLPREAVADFPVILVLAAAEGDQRDLRRIAERFSLLINMGVVAQYSDMQQAPLTGRPFLVILGEQLSFGTGQKIIHHRHFILGQGAGLIGTDDAGGT
ncbi:hypothetical protein D3C75_709200 [compost metagenome]